MTMSADAIARRESSRGNGTTGGEFGYQPHSLPGELAVPDAGRAEIEALLEPSRGRDDFEDRVTALTELRDTLGDQFGSRAIDRMNSPSWRPDLVYIAYDDKLRPSQMDEYLADSNEFMNGDDDSEWLDDSTYDRAEEIAMNLVGDEADVDEYGDEIDSETAWTDLGTSEQDALRSWATDWDESDPADDLVRSTPSQLVQLPVPGAAAALNDSPDLNHADPEIAFAARERMLQTLFTGAGIEMTDKNRESIRELITEGVGGSYEPFSHYQIKVLAYTDLESVTLSGIRTDRPNNIDVDRRVTSTDPHVLVIQRSSGYGQAVQLEGRLTSHLTPNTPAVIDDNQGYGSWNEVAGVYKPGYAPAAPLESEWIARD
ncbi:hypothetical protein [Pseudoclavibacter sp. VKM Ac-2867]|uniref:hypothetical protein n=1 Tax=Pseudoclavibacter sp. VKM Ac-2867 TaxID=2783829 RepID=UPI00188BB64A|nr:hypothetical protein [Pseudoclavibacter sp. VKM Ac-2867]MBF4459553.1 hypothetical protein [Pseudoclavibacter sp. VKM Ac-2867]